LTQFSSLQKSVQAWKSSHSFVGVHTLTQQFHFHWHAIRTIDIGASDN
jgi:hypothetical protein